MYYGDSAAHQKHKRGQGSMQIMSLAAGVASALCLLLGSVRQIESKSADKGTGQVEKPVAGEFRADLPTLTKPEISIHNRLPPDGPGVWVTYRRGVYDVTRFVENHPGGERILMAAGGPVDPFWGIYRNHAAEHVWEILESHRIGNLEEGARWDVDLSKVGDPFALDPIRGPDLIMLNTRPCNAESPPSTLADDFLTPIDLHYVRNHFGVPLEPQRPNLTVEIEGGKSIEVDIEELKKMSKKSVLAVVQCAGNRRKDMHNFRPVQGILWGSGAISCGLYTGVLLRDLLERIGVTSERGGFAHFEALDGYGASIPLSKALDPVGDVVVAYELNGEPITRDHGCPLRVVVPGHVAARSVKFLKKVIVSKDESQAQWQRRDYKLFPPHVTPDTADYSSVPAIQTMPVNSAIGSPERGDVCHVAKQSVPIKGWAWSGDGHVITSVEVSRDGGDTWTRARLNNGREWVERSFADPSTKQDMLRSIDRGWAWTKWEAELVLLKSDVGKELTIMCRARDSVGGEQPRTMDPVYNFRGFNGNAYHTVTVKVEA
ncbi:hypothetical protein HDU93_006652 [Gonapodya sp. JEL0774]|nr:hypothetical protein HDU93_006652 [Gonapodya sp. JEL0774]